MLVAPLTSIKQQLLEDCRKIGFSAPVGDQVLPLWNHTSNSNSITSFLHIWMSDSPFLSCSQQTWKRSFWSAQQCFLSRPSSWRQLRWFSSAIAATRRIYKAFSNSKVRDVLFNCGLAPAEKQPVVAIDECQVFLKEELKGNNHDNIGPWWGLWMDGI